MPFVGGLLVGAAGVGGYRHGSVTVEVVVVGVMAWLA